MFARQWGLIPSCDVESLEHLRRLVEVTGSVEGVVAYKVGFTLGLGYSLPRVVDLIRDFSGLPVIYDHQKAATDIPDTAAKFARTVARAGVSGAIVFPQAGPATQEAYVRELAAQGVTPIVGAHMTHRAYLAGDGGYLTDEAPSRILRAAAAAGVQWFVLPGNQPEAIERHLDLLRQLTRPRVVLPGVGIQGGRIEAILRLTHPAPTHVIVGRSITEADDPREAVLSLCRSLERCWRRRNAAGDG
jgi:orotidine-5'-phosphate decarboxylase